MSIENPSTRKEPPMSDLIEAMRKSMGNVRNWDGELFGQILTRNELDDLATAALAALRETHHVVPKATHTVTMRDHPLRLGKAP